MPVWNDLRRRLIVATLALAALLLGAFGGTVHATSAAWTNDAWSSVAASSSTWTVAGGNTCVALKADGTPAPGGTCSITGISLVVPWGATGDRQTNGRVTVTSSSTYVSFSVDLRPAVPADWSWGTSAIVNGNGGYTTTAGFACSSLPSLTGRTNPAWSTLEIYVVLFEKRSSASGALLCA
jgi:hypothetical protein